MTGHTIFITYALLPTDNDGYARGIHCNYIKKIQTDLDDPKLTDITLSFSNSSDFKFLTSNGLGVGYNANRIYIIVQIVSNDGFESLDEVVASSSDWRYVDVTDQISGLDGELTPSILTSQGFKVGLINYDNFQNYDLNYLNYPTSSSVDELVGGFGEETFFFGNVYANIRADIYTTDIVIDLGKDDFNLSTNKTWNGSESVYISEIGIYDDENNLVAIGKLNNPIPKNQNISRSLSFQIDF